MNPKLLYYLSNYNVYHKYPKLAKSNLLNLSKNCIILVDYKDPNIKHKLASSQHSTNQAFIDLNFNSINKSKLFLIQSN